jgi:hypothetical protein
MQARMAATPAALLAGDRATSDSEASCTTVAAATPMAVTARMASRRGVAVPGSTRLDARSSNDQNASSATSSSAPPEIGAGMARSPSGTKQTAPSSSSATERGAARPTRSASARRSVAAAAPAADPAVTLASAASATAPTAVVRRARGAVT